MVSGERIIAISQYIKDYIINNYPDTDESRIEIIHRGISKDKFPYGFKPSAEWLSSWQKQYPQFKDTFLVTLPGRITLMKRLFCLGAVALAALVCGLQSTVSADNEIGFVETFALATPQPLL